MSKDNNIQRDPADKKAGDEIIEILDNYRKSQQDTRQESESAPITKEQPKVTAGQPILESDIDESIIPKGFATHLTAHDGEAAEGRVMDIAHNPHFSDTANKKEIQKAQRQSKQQRFQKEKKPSKKMSGVLGGGSVFLKAVVYIAIVLILSVYLSYYIISIANDVFAFVKDETPVRVFIRENVDAKEVADVLVENELVEYGWVFRLYLKYRSKGEEIRFISGEHELSANMNYDKLIQRLTLKGVDRTEVRIVIPEGLTVDQTIDLFLKNGIGTKEGFVEAINNYPYKHEFVRRLEEIGYSEDRIYRLEGYLFPDTYDFYVSTPEHLVINKLLNNFNDKFWKDYKTEYAEVMEGHNMTCDDIITLASMLQAEGNNALDFEYMSDVFHSRIKDSKKYPEYRYLQSDATIQYVLDARKEDLTDKDLQLDNPYNTYLYQGLPPGAICSPGYDAISAALFPSQPEQDGKSFKAYYFVSNKAGHTYYSATLSGHNRNKEQVKKDNAAIEAGTYYN